MDGTSQDNCFQNQSSTHSMARYWATEDCTKVCLHYYTRGPPVDKYLRQISKECRQDPYNIIWIHMH